MESLKFHLTNVSPLIMHNGQLADPRNHFTRKIKEISSKRSKVDADYDEMARLEWFGGLYLKDGIPCLPAICLEGTLIGKSGAARKQKMGKEAAAGLIVPDDFPLIYDGPKDLDELWQDENFQIVSKVNVRGSSVMRTRPIFHDWEVDVEILYVPTMLNPDHICQWMETSGREVGLMDWRPRYGRFSVERI